MISYTQKDIDKFWGKIIFPEDEVNDCWEYNGFKDRDSYGDFKASGKTIRANRFSFMIHNPDINIDGLIIRHSCHNPGCVNPKHLSSGTQQDNINDKLEASRQAKGENHWSSKHSDSDVKNLLDFILENKYKNSTELCLKFNMIFTGINQIINNTTWKHITKDYDLKLIKKIEAIILR
jgi:hypothetical protein